MIWRITMVLLSTLAALVIIVHSAEEDYETYRRELRPRMLDTGTPRTYEQPWRTMEVEPVMQQSTPEETWPMNSSEEPTQRRRPGRKRRRRPEHSSSEDLLPIERYSYLEEPIRPYLDVGISANRKVSDNPNSKKQNPGPRPDRWDSPVEEDRPVRRRGQRRKRPSLETVPELSEFNDFNFDGHLQDKNKHVTTIPLNPLVVDEYRHFERDNIRTSLTESERFRQPLVLKPEVKSDEAQHEIYFPYTDDRKQKDQIYSQTNLQDGASQRSPPITEDKSLSEFSIEDTTSEIAIITEDEITTTNNIREKSLGYFKDAHKAQNEGPIDPLTLKDILRRSNGTSLSEILQQHNLSLTDLLHGREIVLSILKPKDSVAPKDLSENKPNSDISAEEKEPTEEKILLNSESKYGIDLASKNAVAKPTTKSIEIDTTTDVETTSTEKSIEDEAPKRPKIRRFPTAMRRKTRIRPMMNTTYKSQLSRDMLALNARKYFNNRRRNITKEWKDVIPMKKNISNEDTNNKTEIETTTANNAIDETTTLQDGENCTRSAEVESEQNNTSENIDETDVNAEKQNKTDTERNFINLQPTANVTDTTIVPPNITQAVNASGLRRQAFNHRLKKKRLKQKNLTTEPPQDDIMMNLFGIPNLVSSSEFIARTDGPKSSLDDITILEDFMTTETPHKPENRKSTKYSVPRTATTPQFVFIPISTEETAKMEIEEIFNDTRTSAKLSKILKERNMTLSELVEHRERGSSHVHLADIFHNASKEPNPDPEPFLSKSLIEPISKETYPLRALLDANTHDTTAKATTIDPVPGQTEVNIPVIMDFGNNVNENAENMGIMSLFHNFKKHETNTDTTSLKKDSQGSLYETSITVVNTTDVRNGNDTLRESRVIHVINDNQEDIVSWNEIFSLMRRNYENDTEKLVRTPVKGILPVPAEKITKPSLEEDLDGDGLIVIEDLQNLKDSDSNVASASNENLNFNTYERAEVTDAPGILDKIPSQTKSVTVVTASIAGLAMVLFLLTFVAYRWQQQRSMARKNSFSAEHVPSPVFEHRKGHKNNSSSRSISPMLSSNIYTLNTLDSRNGKESPDYMWDSLRKPFQ